ncbi:MAG: hypothetical protein HOV96_22225 [Nonomuraea sp.]|nr:hypothetical protein [Nonomuraea sp.]
MTFARRLTGFGAGLAMAATVLSAPAVAAAPPEGAYWHTRALTTSAHPWRFGAKSDPYSLVQREIMESWSAPDGRQWSGFRELGARPATPADEKAWRRDGSPSKWSESIDGKTVKLSTAPSNGQLLPARGENQFSFAGQRLTYDEVQRLPADPVRLKDWIRRCGQVSRVPDDALDAWISGTLPQLLYTVPAPKEVRAAAYQALLTMPGVRAAGTAKDDLGRSGAAVLADRTGKPQRNGDSVTISMIVDTGRMVLLARSQTVKAGGKALGGKSYDETLTEVGWTDAQPTVPALP